MMELHGYHDILVLLAALGVVVPVFHRLRVNPVLGYLLAGILIGPDGLRRLAGTLPLLSYVTGSSREAVALFGELQQGVKCRVVGAGPVKCGALLGRELPLHWRGGRLGSHSEPGRGRAAS